MPKYKFKAMDLNNKPIRGTFIARDEADLKQIVDSQDYYLISYKKIPESSQMFSFLEKINLADFTLFCRQFAIMLNSGLNIDKTVLILKNATQNSKLKSILEVVYNDLMKGMMLSESFAKYPKTFPVFFRNMIAIGEKSGNLPLIFVRLADYYEKDAQTKKKVKGALAYPIFLIGVAIAALAVIALVVMPQFEGVFSEFDSDLPAVSQIVINVSHFIKENWKQVLLAIVAIVAIFILTKKIKSVNHFYDELKLKAPIISNLTIASLTSQFASGFSVLLNSGLPLLNCIDTISRLLGNVVVEEKLQLVKNQISSGRTVADSLETINLFPKLLIEMINVGESTGHLEEVLDRVTGFFEEQLDDAIKKMTGAIQPIMLAVIGGIVVVVLLAIFMPMLGLMSAIEGAV